jgi:hypothetical protein
VLGSAARRGRLGASTFQLLNTGFTAALVCDAASIGVFHREANFVAVLVSRLLLAMPSIRSLKRYGPPRAVQLVPFGRLAHFQEPLAVGYALLALVAGGVGIAAALGKLGSTSLCIHLLPAAALLALRGAALAGPKRLSSATYLQLNRSLRAFGLARAIADAATLVKGAGLFRWQMVASVAADLALAAVCTVGLRRGANYQDLQPGEEQPPAVIDVKVM